MFKYGSLIAIAIFISFSTPDGGTIWLNREIIIGVQKPVKGTGDGNSEILYGGGRVRSSDKVEDIIKKLEDSYQSDKHCLWR